VKRECDPYFAANLSGFFAFSMQGPAAADAGEKTAGFFAKNSGTPFANRDEAPPLNRKG